MHSSHSLDVSVRLVWTRIEGDERDLSCVTERGTGGKVVSIVWGREKVLEQKEERLHIEECRDLVWLEACWAGSRRKKLDEEMRVKGVLEWVKVGKREECEMTQNGNDTGYWNTEGRTKQTETPSWSVCVDY